LEFGKNWGRGVEVEVVPSQQKTRGVEVEVVPSQQKTRGAKVSFKGGGSFSLFLLLSP